MTDSTAVLVLKLHNYKNCIIVTLSVFVSNNSNNQIIYLQTSHIWTLVMSLYFFCLFDLINTVHYFRDAVN